MNSFGDTRASVAVPDVRGMLATEAAAAIADVGFRVVFVALRDGQRQRCSPTCVLTFAPSNHGNVIALDCPQNSPT